MDSQSRTLRAAIIESLRASPNTASAIAEALTIRTTDVSAKLRQMVYDGEVRKAGKIKLQNYPYRATVFALAVVRRVAIWKRGGKGL